MTYAISLGRRQVFEQVGQDRGGVDGEEDGGLGVEGSRRGTLRRNSKPRLLMSRRIVAAFSSSWESV